MKIFATIGLLTVSNIFMTLAWYGHLKFKTMKGFDALPLVAVILLSWGIALFEYCFQVPANRLGYAGNGGPFSLFQLKIIQEVLSLTVFIFFALLVFRTETFKLNYLISFVFIVLAVFFAFKD